MKHPGTDPWYVKDRCGPLFVFYHRDASVCPSIGDDDGRVAWCICPDDEDKAEERSIAQGCAATPEDAMRGVAEAASAIAREMLDWASGAPGPTQTAAASRAAEEEARR